MNEHKKEVRYQQTIVAAHYFVFKSRDGVEIANHLEVSPYKLFKITRSTAWKKCLRFWSYDGNPLDLGAEFYKTVEKRRKILEMKRSFKFAFQKWKQLFEIEGDV